jgi:hypothetical protein
LSKFSIPIILKQPREAQLRLDQARKTISATILSLKKLKMRLNKRGARRRAIS